MKTYYLSRYAMTKGIEEVQGEPCHNPQYVNANGYPYSVFRLGRDIHETRQEALAAASADVQRKIQSLRKQLHKLERLEFK